MCSLFHLTDLNKSKSLSFSKISIRIVSCIQMQNPLLSQDHYFSLYDDASKGKLDEVSGISHCENTQLTLAQFSSFAQRVFFFSFVFISQREWEQIFLFSSSSSNIILHYVRFYAWYWFSRPKQKFSHSLAELPS
jgi:hypothetical protein